jgi:hypothetical protein
MGLELPVISYLVGMIAPRELAPRSQLVRSRRQLAAESSLRVVKSSHSLFNTWSLLASHAHGPYRGLLVRPKSARPSHRLS